MQLNGNLPDTTSNSTSGMCVHSDAPCKGVLPLLSAALISAPKETVKVIHTHPMYFLKTHSCPHILIFHCKLEQTLELLSTMASSDPGVTPRLTLIPQNSFANFANPITLIDRSWLNQIPKMLSAVLHTRLTF